MWGKTAEALSQYLTKGKQVFIEAKDVHIQTYDKNDGTQGFKLAADFVGVKFAYDGQSQQQAHQQPQQQQQQAAHGVLRWELDDSLDIPF